MYEEASDPEEFFVPHAWRVCLRTSCVDICWFLDRISLFDVASTGLVDTLSSLQDQVAPTDGESDGFVGNACTNMERGADMV